MTRQRLHHIARNAQGLCMYCLNALHPGSKTMCFYHLTKVRSYYRKKLGLKPGYISGKGRPAITRLPIPSDFDKAA